MNKGSGRILYKFVSVLKLIISAKGSVIYSNHCIRIKEEAEKEEVGKKEKRFEVLVRRDMRNNFHIGE